MDWVARYLDHVRYEKRLAERTHALYTLDLQKLKFEEKQKQITKLVGNLKSAPFIKNVMEIL